MMSAEMIADLALMKMPPSTRRQVNDHGYDARTMLVEMVKFARDRDDLRFQMVAIPRCGHCGKKSAMAVIGSNDPGLMAVIGNAYKLALIAGGADPMNPCTMGVVEAVLDLKDDDDD